MLSRFSYRSYPCNSFICHVPYHITEESRSLESQDEKGIYSINSQNLHGQIWPKNGCEGSFLNTSQHIARRPPIELFSRLTKPRNMLTDFCHSVADIRVGVKQVMMFVCLPFTEGRKLL